MKYRARSPCPLTSCARERRDVSFLEKGSCLPEPLVYAPVDGGGQFTHETSDSPTIGSCSCVCFVYPRNRRGE